jgi:hypothetical protein
MTSSSILPTCEPLTFDPGQVEQCRKWMLCGASAADLQEALKTAYPDADVPALTRYVMEQIRLSGDVDRQLVRGFVVEGIRTLYAKSTEIGDLGTALRCLKELKEFT